MVVWSIVKRWVRRIDGDKITDNEVYDYVVGSDRDSYGFTGEITGFWGDDNLRVYLTDEEIDPPTLAANPRFENTLTVENNGGLTAYLLVVKGV